MAEMALCMIKLRTVNMADICQAMSGDSKASSNYRKLQRFIGEELIPQKSLAELTCAIKGLDKEKTWKLTMDRTNWKIGQTHINILYLGVCCNNVAIPLFFFFRR